MKSKSELTDFYYKTLFPALRELDEMRRHLLYRIFVVGVLFSLIFVFLFFLFQTLNFIVFAIFAYIAIGSFIYKFLIKDYTQEFKYNIIKPLIEAISKELSYNSNYHISEHLFIRSDLFRRPHRISGNDYVKGLVGGTKIEFSDIHAEVKHKNSKNKESWSTLFRGLFIVAEFNKNFTTKTLVLPDSAQNVFGELIGGWLQSNNLARDELVRMDDNEFEREFVVYSKDQIEARYILSHSLMKKLLELKKKSKHPLYVSFVGNHIHIAIEYKKDLFEPSIFYSLLDYKIAMEYIGTLHLALGIVDELKLNEKIWSKL